jgi:hypothetical protein
MKKALLVSTAIVGGPLLLATPAVAGAPIEMSIGGNMDIQFGAMDQDVDNPDRGYDVVTDTEIHFNFRGEADNGLKYGAQVQLEVDQGGTNNSDEVYTFLSGDWGRIQIGDKDGAEDQMIYDAGLTQSGIGGIDGDVDRWFVNTAFATSFPDIVDTSDATKATYYSPRVAGIQVGFSFTPQTDSQGQNVANDTPVFNNSPGPWENHIGLGINFQETINDVEFGIALTGGFADPVNEDEDNDLGNFAVGGYVSYAGWSLGGSYGDNLETREPNFGGGDMKDDFFYDIGLGYSMGPWSASVGYLHSEAKFELFGNTRDDEFDNFAISGGYTYSPGLYVYADLLIVSADVSSGNDNDGTVLLLGHVLSF